MLWKIVCSLTALLAWPVLADEEASFQSSIPATWQQYDPRALAGFSPALFDVSGGQCRLAAPPPTTMPEYLGAGLARAGVFAPASYTDSVASVDVTAWYPTTNRDNDGTFIGVFTRVQSPVAPGTLTGYSASIIDMGPNSGPGGNGRNGRLQLMLVYQESNFVPITGYEDFPLDPTRDYRLVLVSRGNTHTARVFDLTNPTAHVAQLVAQITNPEMHLPSGRTGFMVLTDRVAPVDATFDNFLAWDATPPALTAQPGTNPSTIALSCDLVRAMASYLESSTDPGAPANDWLNAIPLSASSANGQLTTVFAVDGPRRFFRRKSL